MFGTIPGSGNANGTAKADAIDRLARALDGSDAVVIGAGAGLSTSAGFSYTGRRFDRYFADFESAYGFHDMYSGGFYPYPGLEEHWAFWSRYIYVNRYLDAPKRTYETLLSLVQDKDCFVITTNVDHCFQKAGFSKERLFYTQGDYGLLQCSVPCHDAVYDNEETVKAMLEAQGWRFAPDGDLLAPDDGAPDGRIPGDLVPVCPECGKPMSMNLRADDTFVEDEGWHRASGRYTRFLRRHQGMKVLYLELGVGYNTPGIIKYPFWKMTLNNPDAVYACINRGQAVAPVEIESRSICIDADIDEALRLMV